MRRWWWLAVASHGVVFSVNYKLYPSHRRDGEWVRSNTGRNARRRKLVTASSSQLETGLESECSRPRHDAWVPFKMKAAFYYFLKISWNGYMGKSTSACRCFFERGGVLPGYVSMSRKTDGKTDRRTDGQTVSALIRTVFCFFSPCPCKGHGHINTMIYRRCKTVKLIRKPLNSSNKQSQMP